MKIHKYETMYPRTLWIVNCDSEDFTQLTNKFIFYHNEPRWNRIYTDIKEDLERSYETAVAGCYVVEEKSTGKLGILMVIFCLADMDASTVAHESVHIADFYYEVSGCNTEDFTDGNEAYAYLVGWIAGCISNVLIKEKDGLK